MSHAVRFFARCLLAASSTFALAQATPPAKPPVGSAVPPAQVYGHLLTLLESEFVGAAEAMPEDKYDFAPPVTMGEFKGVRTFADQVKHVDRRQLLLLWQSRHHRSRREGQERRHR